MAEDSFDPRKINSKSISQKLKAYMRILKLTKKPSREEFRTISKVAGIGILAIGFVGFVVYILLVEMPRWV